MVVYYELRQVRRADSKKVNKEKQGIYSSESNIFYLAIEGNNSKVLWNSGWMPLYGSNKDKGNSISPIKKEDLPPVCQDLEKKVEF